MGAKGGRKSEIVVVVAARRAEQDRAFVAEMTAEIRRLFPRCPRARAEQIARHAGARGSGASFARERGAKADVSLPSTPSPPPIRGECDEHEHGGDHNPRPFRHRLCGPQSAGDQRIARSKVLKLVCRHFGSLAKAILAAGMVPETPSKTRATWLPVEVARACRAFRFRNGHWPNWADVKRRPGELPSTAAMIRCFGGTRSIDVQLGDEAILAGIED